MSTFLVPSGVVSSGLTVPFKGDELGVYGTVVNTTVNYTGGSGLVILGGGKAENTTVNTGGLMFVFKNGCASNTTISSGGQMFVDPDGSAYYTTIKSGSMVIGEGGSAHYIDIKNGGVLTQQGRTDNINIYSGGTMNALGREGDACRITVFEGGVLNVISSVQGTVVSSAGSMIVQIAGITYMTTLNGGTLTVLGDIDVTDVNDGGFLNMSSILYDEKIFGGSATNTNVNSGGYMKVVSYCKVFDTKVNSGGYMEITSGGEASDTYLNGGVMDVSNGGYVRKVTVGKGGNLSAYKGAEVMSIKEDGGYVQIKDGADASFAENTFSDITLSSGSATVHSKTTAVNTIVGVNSLLEIYAGGKASNTIVNRVGKIEIYSGGIANGNIVSSGGYIIIHGGGTLTGALQIENGGEVKAYEGSIIDFNVAEQADPSIALINDWSRIIQGNNIHYTITVSADQASGTYVLADNATEFNKSITIKNTAGKELGSLTVNNTLTLGDSKAIYSLVNEASSLKLTISTEKDKPLTNLKGTKSKLSWDAVNGYGYVVQYSTDNFEHTLTVSTAKNALDTAELPQGTFQWRIRRDDSTQWTRGSNISSGKNNASPHVVSLTTNGTNDLFFANAAGTWDKRMAAQHVGFLNGWSGTNDAVQISGKNKFNNIFRGSTDANILILTDDTNGDAIFLDDIFTDMPAGIDAQARISQIDEIRAGAGDDLLDMTSQRFEYSGSGMTIHGGLGNDTIWANNGKNLLFGDAGNDRIIGGAGKDIIVGGIGDDVMHGGGGNDIFCFGGDWGKDTVEQLKGGKVTLWFDSGSSANWDSTNLKYTSGSNSVTVKGVKATDVTLIFGNKNIPSTEDTQYSYLLSHGCFDRFTSENTFEDTKKGLLA